MSKGVATASDYSHEQTVGTYPRGILPAQSSHERGRIELLLHDGDILWPEALDREAEEQATLADVHPRNIGPREGCGDIPEMLGRGCRVRHLRIALEPYTP